ncbi:hypothetical protein [Thiobacillus sp.]|uniref:hypothetical protein n=1 Tax=Thiobacillus sp. TaxID=924 RepID=UPI0025FAD7AD|nr:hypothetical protein [Thiobacillus sp.]
MKKTFVIGGVIILLYFGSVFLRAYLWELEAAKYLEEALQDIAKPWNEENLVKRASWWLREKSNLTPSEITRMAKEDFGNLVEIQKRPNCNIQQGFDTYSKDKKTYAICLASMKFDKKAAEMKVRLVQESGGWKINDFVSVNTLPAER